MAKIPEPVHHADGSVTERVGDVYAVVESAVRESTQVVSRVSTVDDVDLDEHHPQQPEGTS